MADWVQSEMHAGAGRKVSSDSAIGNCYYKEIFSDLQLGETLRTGQGVVEFFDNDEAKLEVWNRFCKEEHGPCSAD